MKRWVVFLVAVLIIAVCNVSYAGMWFKHGQRVTCTISGMRIDDARISIDPSCENVFICQNLKDGQDAPDKLGYRYSWTIGKNGTWPDSGEYTNVTNLKVIDGFYPQVGDIVILNSGQERKVLAVCGEAFLLDAGDGSDASDASDDWDSFSYAEKWGWKIKEEMEGEIFTIGGKKVSVQTIKEALKSYFE